MADDIEVMRYYPIEDMTGKAATGVSTSGYTPARVSWTAPATPLNTNMQEVDQQRAFEDIDRSRTAALSAGFGQTILHGLYQTFSKPVFQANPEYSFDAKKQDIYQSNIVLSDARAAHLFQAQSPEEVNYLLGQYKEEDIKAQAASAHPGIAMVGSLPDVDMVIPFIGKGAGVALKAGELSARTMGLERIGATLERSSKLASTGANAMFGDVSANRWTNAVANAAIGAGVTAAADAYSDQDVSAGQYLMNIGLSGIAGFAFPAISHEMRLADINAPKLPDVANLKEMGARVAKQVEQVGAVAGQKEVAAEVKATLNHDLQDVDLNKIWELPVAARNVDPEALARLTPDEFAAYGLHQAQARRAGLVSGDAEIASWLRNGGDADSLFHTVNKAGELTPAHNLMTQNLQELWSHYFPESRLRVIWDDGVQGKSGTRGAFGWSGKDTGTMFLSNSILTNPKLGNSTMIHEFGHALTIRTVASALDNGDMAVIRTYFDAFKRHQEGMLKDASGSVALHNLDLKSPTEIGTTAKELRGTEDLGRLRLYSESPLEWMAQQTLKYAEQTVREAKMGKDISQAAAKRSAFYSALPKPMQNLLWNLIDKMHGVWKSFFARGLDKPDQEFAGMLENLAANPARVDNYSNFERTAADLDAFGNPVQERVGHTIDLEAGEPTPPPSGTNNAKGPAATVTAPEIPYGPQSLKTSNEPAMLRWFEKHMGQGWFSVFDNLNSRGGYLSGLANMLVQDGAGRNAFSAATYKRAAELELSAARASFDNAIADATGVKGFGRFVQSAKFREGYRNLSVQVREELTRKYNAFADGVEIPVSDNPVIENLCKVYVDSGFANKSLDFQKTAGRFGSDVIDHNPYYVPMHMTADSFRDLVRTGKATEAEIQHLIHTQLKNMFTDLPPEYVEKISKNIYQGVLDRGMGRSSKKGFFEGTTLDELQAAMLNAGFDPTEMKGFMERFRKHAMDRKRDGNLRARLDWDWDIKVPTSKGGEISMADLVGKDLIKDLEGHQRVVSGHYGLGMVGFHSDADLNSAMERALNDYQTRGASSADLKYTRSLLENVTDSLLGRYVGEEIPPLLRATSAMSSAIVLKNPVFYMSLEAATASEKIGAGRFIKNLVMPSGMLDGLKGVDKESAQILLDSLNGKYMAEGRWKPVLTHFEDGYEVMSSLDAAAYHASAASRFINGTEYVRRRLSKAVLGAVVGDLYRAARGGKREAEFLSRYGATPDLLDRIKQNLDKVGPEGHELQWDAKTRAQAETVLMNVTDQIVQANRLGEVPAFMQFSSVGKALLPFTSFIAGAWNKVLRKGLADEDMAGFAVMVMYQIAGGAMAEGLRNASAGRAPTDSGSQNFLVRSVSNTNVASWFGMALDSMTSPNNSGAVQFAFPRALMNVGSQHNLKALVNATPLTVVPGMGIVTSVADN